MVVLVDIEKPFDKVHIRYNFEEHGKANIKKCMMQGYRLSPILFNLYDYEAIYKIKETVEGKLIYVHGEYR